MSKKYLYNPTAIIESRDRDTAGIAHLLLCVEFPDVDFIEDSGLIAPVAEGLDDGEVLEIQHLLERILGVV